MRDFTAPPMPWAEVCAPYAKDYAAAVGVHLSAAWRRAAPPPPPCPPLRATWPRPSLPDNDDLFDLAADPRRQPPYWAALERWHRLHCTRGRGGGAMGQRGQRMRDQTDLAEAGVYEGETVLFFMIAGGNEAEVASRPTRVRVKR